MIKSKAANSRVRVADGESERCLFALSLMTGSCRDDKDILRFLFTSAQSSEVTNQRRTSQTIPMLTHNYCHIIFMFRQ